MTGLRNAGSESLTGCFFGAIMLGIIVAVLWPVLSEMSPLRAAGGLVFGLIFGWGGALIAVILLMNLFFLPLHVGAWRRGRRFERLVEAVTLPTVPEGFDLEAEMGWALDRDVTIDKAWTVVRDNEVLHALASRDGPHRRQALLLIMARGHKTDELKAIVFPGLDVVEAGPASERVEFLLRYWTDTPIAEKERRRPEDALP
jgi:hypothetical protein